MKTTDRHAIRRVFSVVCDAVRAGTPLGTAVRDEIDRVVARISSRAASALYVDLCRIQVAHDTAVCPDLALLDGLLDWSDLELLGRFRALVIENGQIVGLVADAVELPDEHSRLERRSTARIEREAQAKLHREDSRWNAEWSRFMFEARTENAAAYARVRERLQASATASRKLREWEIVVLSDPDELGAREATFWYAVQVARCTSEQKRAVCHKLSLCKAMQARDTIRRLRVQLHVDLFVARHSAEGTTEGTADDRHPHPPLVIEDVQLTRLSRSSWCLRVLRRLWPRRRVRTRGGVGRSDSSRPVPAPPRSG